MKISGTAASDLHSTEARSWLFDLAFPFWATAGVDTHFGGFLEELDERGKPTDCTFKRLRVLCRQTYVFSHAALMGWERGRELSTVGYEFLVERAWLGTDRGWARRLTRWGGVLDPTPDLYDLAFVLFALAWRYRLTHEREVKQRADQTLLFIESTLGTGETGGFWSDASRSGPRLQNPHMHLLEACLAIFEASKDERFLALARNIVGLFRKKLFDGETLAERFDINWRRVPNQYFEPGHHFEWAWILAQYQKCAGENMVEEVAALVMRGERGLDGLGKVCDAIDSRGCVLRSSSRAWPNAERIKGWLGLSEIASVDPYGAVRSSMRLLFEHYMSKVLPGAWVDQLDSQNRPTTKNVPASVLYHLVLAFSEVLRLGGDAKLNDMSPANLYCS